MASCRRGCAEFRAALLQKNVTKCSAEGLGVTANANNQLQGAYSYDAAGNSKTLSYTYNLDNSVATLTYPSGAVVTYTPDAAGRALSAVDSSNNINYVTSATYGPDNSLTGFTSGNSSTFAGITNSWQYSPRLQICRITALTTGSVPTSCADSSHTGNVLDLGYNLNLGNGDNGNVIGITNYKDSTRSQSFTYDTLNRLTSAQNAGTNCNQMTVNGKTAYWGNNYGYDPWGNLLQKSVTKCSAENLSVSVLSNNQLSGYSYDAAGNMTHDSTTNLNYTFDAENRITGAAGYTYTYDADGNRVEKTNGSTGTIYWYMKPGIVAESDLGGNLKSEYVFFDGGRAARKDFSGGTTSVAYYFSDHLETASVITNSAGTIIEDEDYYPWGGELQFVNSDSNHYKFTSKERDSETGLDYFGARYYGNWTGRFTTPDWAAKATAVPYAELDDPQSLNLYSYVRNRPTATGDPDGHLGGGEEGGGPQTPQSFQIEEEPDLSTGIDIRQFHQPGMALYRSGSAPVVPQDDFERSGFDQGQDTQQGDSNAPKDHFVSISDWPTGAGGFHHTGIAVDNDDTHGFSTLDPSLPWWKLLFWAPKGRMEDDIEQHTNANGEVARHSYNHIYITAGQAKFIRAAIEARTANPGRYNLVFRNCTSPIEGILHAAGVRGIPHREIFVPALLHQILLIERALQ